jgi:hypothetical protein
MQRAQIAGTFAEDGWINRPAMYSLNPALARLFDLPAADEVKTALTAFGLPYLDDHTAELFVAKLVRYVASEATSPTRAATLANDSRLPVATPIQQGSLNGVRDSHHAHRATAAPPQTDRIRMQIEELKLRMKAAAAAEEFMKAAEMKKTLTNAEDLERRRAIALKEV